MSLPAAAWYDDPAQPDQLRYWNGAEWTSEYAPKNGKVPAVPGSAVSTARPEPARDPNVLWESVGKPLTGIGAGRYRLTRELLYFEKGAMSLKAQQIATHEIHDVDASQTMTQKARGVGTIVLTAVRQSGREIVQLEDLPNFREGVQIINQVAHEARDNQRVKQQTQHVNYQGQPAYGQPAAPAPSAAAPAAGGGSDLNAELAKLAAFKEQGILDEDEFKAAKRKLLGL